MAKASGSLTIPFHLGSMVLSHFLDTGGFSTENQSRARNPSVSSVLLQASDPYSEPGIPVPRYPFAMTVRG